MLPAQTASGQSVFLRSNIESATDSNNGPTTYNVKTCEKVMLHCDHVSLDNTDWAVSDSCLYTWKLDDQILFESKSGRLQLTVKPDTTSGVYTCSAECMDSHKVWHQGSQSNAFTLRVDPVPAGKNCSDSVIMPVKLG